MKKQRKRKRFSCICLICWIFIPLFIIGMLILDGIGLYSFTTERLIIIGVYIIVALIPFISEITIKGFSFKKEK